MAFHLARRKPRLSSNPSLVQLFSTCSMDPPPPDEKASGEKPSRSSTSSPSSSSSSSSSSSQFSFTSSYLSEVKAHLKERTPPQQQNDRKPFARSDFNARNPASLSVSGNRSGSLEFSLEAIKKNLSQFRQRTGATSRGNFGVAPSSQSQPPVSLQELYNRNVLSMSGNSSSVGSGTPKRGSEGFDALRNSLRKMKTKEEAKKATKSQLPVRLSLSKFEDSLKVKPSENVRSNVIGGTEALPASVFAKELEQKNAEKGKEGEKEENKILFLKNYSPEELGTELAKLRPEGKKQEGGFTLQELNERLMKLREKEEKEVASLRFSELRATLLTLSSAEAEAKNKNIFKRVDILGELGVTHKYMLHPPKEHLVETYFHPDNMSSAEKMKIELAKVRDEFKMSESDCGSARVQVAQLTTKIKHLSSALHKKDKHSRKGLQGMVQRRKKLLKYLRRTDWDSYCLVLSKLGLRDNPDYKN